MTEIQTISEPMGYLLSASLRPPKCLWNSDVAGRYRVIRVQADIKGAALLMLSARSLVISPLDSDRKAIRFQSESMDDYGNRNAFARIEHRTLEFCIGPEDLLELLCQREGLQIISMSKRSESKDEIAAAYCQSVGHGYHCRVRVTIKGRTAFVSLIEMHGAIDSELAHDLAVLDATQHVDKYYQTEPLATASCVHSLDEIVIGLRFPMYSGWVTGSEQEEAWKTQAAFARTWSLVSEAISPARGLVHVSKSAQNSGDSAANIRDVLNSAQGLHCEHGGIVLDRVPQLVPPNGVGELRCSAFATRGFWKSLPVDVVYAGWAIGRKTVRLAAIVPSPRVDESAWGHGRTTFRTCLAALDRIILACGL